jgi:RNA polymerase sigma-70 factor (ECF subfamily)
MKLPTSAPNFRRGGAQRGIGAVDYLRGPKVMSDVTCWTLVRDAAAGSPAAREQFIRRYMSVVQDFLHARWQGKLVDEEREDAAQEVFVECLKDQGALTRVEARPATSFRTYLCALTRNVARRYEERGAQRVDAPASSSFDLERAQADDTSASRAFDRAWAGALVAQAAERFEQSRACASAAGQRRVELLRSCIREGRGVSELAREWGVEPAWLHREYRRALRDFETALREVVAFHHPGEPEAVERECRDLLALVQ